MDPCPHEEKVDEYERFAHDNPRAIAAWVVYLESRIALEKENP